MSSDEYYPLRYLNIYFISLKKIKKEKSLFFIDQLLKKLIFIYDSNKRGFGVLGRSEEHTSELQSL